MRNFSPTRQYPWTKFSTMNQETFTELFLTNVDKWARKHSTNYQKKYTVRFMKINGATIENMEPFLANNTYEFFAKFRAKVREISNRELFNYELAMDIIDEYVEHETARSRPDMNLSLENIVDTYIDNELCDGSRQYNLKLDSDDSEVRFTSEYDI